MHTVGRAGDTRSARNWSVMMTAFNQLAAAQETTPKTVKTTRLHRDAMRSFNRRRCRGAILLLLLSAVFRLCVRATTAMWDVVVVVVIIIWRDPRERYNNNDIIITVTPPRPAAEIARDTMSVYGIAPPSPAPLLQQRPDGWRNTSEL